jgi:hypothetical protein
MMKTVAVEVDCHAGVCEEVREIVEEGNPIGHIKGSTHENS